MVRLQYILHNLLESAMFFSWNAKKRCFQENHQSIVRQNDKKITAIVLKKSSVVTHNWEPKNTK